MRRRARRRRRRRRALQPARHRRRRRFDRRGRRHSRARPPGRGGDRPYVGSHQARRDRDRRARPGRDFEDDRLGDGREGRRRRLRRGARRRRRRRRGNNRVADGTHEPSHRRRARLHVHPVRVRSAELHRRHVRVACDDGEPGIDGAAVQVLRRPEKRPGVRVAVLLRHDHHVPEGSARVGDAATDEVGRRGRRRNRRGAPGGGGGAVGSFWGGGRRYRGVHEDVPYGDGEWPRREIEQHASRYDNTQAADTARKKTRAQTHRAPALSLLASTQSRHFAAESTKENPTHAQNSDTGMAMNSASMISEPTVLSPTRSGRTRTGVAWYSSEKSSTYNVHFLSSPPSGNASPSVAASTRAAPISSSFL
mmetsp:Transcript_12868/g.53936  ORF Transcript_12868/g.53936 Transcript_12868/m.53936 type:complete len:365 (-) Transcript_12868:705-1799(-)